MPRRRDTLVITEAPQELLDGTILEWWRTYFGHQGMYSPRPIRGIPLSGLVEISFDWVQPDLKDVSF